MRLVFFILAFVFFSCDRADVVFENFKELRNEYWAENDTVSFYAEIPNNREYALNIYVRNTIDYEMTNLWCFLVVQDSLSTVVLQDTVNIKIAEFDGRWVGKGDGIKVLKHGINKNYIFLPSGELKFSLIQGMGLEQVKGIKSVGIEIVKTEE